MRCGASSRGGRGWRDKAATVRFLRLKCGMKDGIVLKMMEEARLMLCPGVQLSSQFVEAWDWDSDEPMWRNFV